MRVEKKPEYKGEIAINPITDIRELRVKEQSYDSFRNKYLANQLVFAKKMRSFFEQYPNLKSTFKEILN